MPGEITERPERSQRRSAGGVKAARRGAGDPADSKLERETGFEPATSTLARSHSTTELFPPLPDVQVYRKPTAYGKANRCDGVRCRPAQIRASLQIPRAAEGAVLRRVRRCGHASVRDIMARLCRSR